MRSGARLAAAVATAVTLACLPASAQEVSRFYSGNDLWSLCSGNSGIQSGLCMGYVRGIADAMMVQPPGVAGRRACFPEQVTAEQARDVVKRYLEQHPEVRHYSAASLAAEALAEAFPRKP
jgi:Rap1a immunity proteins